jgi:hypothetical protein
MQGYPLPNISTPATLRAKVRKFKKQDHKAVPKDMKIVDLRPLKSL